MGILAAIFGMRQFDEEWRLLIQARSWLSERGYRLIASRGPEGMDQGFDLYAGSRSGIRIMADRGSWFLEIRPGTGSIDAVAWRDWYSLEAWSICLGRAVIFHDPRATDQIPASAIHVWASITEDSWRLQPQLDYLRSHLPDIEAACDPQRIETTLESLKDAQNQVAAFPVRRRGKRRPEPKSG